MKTKYRIAEFNNLFWIEAKFNEDDKWVKLNGQGKQAMIGLVVVKYYKSLKKAKKAAKALKKDIIYHYV